MKRILRRCLRILAFSQIVLGLLVAFAILFSPNRYYQYHALEATPTQKERYAYADSCLLRLGVVDGYAGGFYWEKQVGRGGGPKRVLTNGWFPEKPRPLQPGEMNCFPIDLTCTRKVPGRWRRCTCAWLCCRRRLVMIQISAIHDCLLCLPSVLLCVLLPSFSVRRLRLQCVTGNFRGYTCSEVVCRRLAIRIECLCDRLHRACSCVHRG